LKGSNPINDLTPENRDDRWYETWHTVAADAPMESSSLTIEGLGDVAICKWAQSVPPSACFSSHSLFLFLFVMQL